MQMTLQPQLSPEQFINSIRDFNFQQRYFKWQSYVKTLKQVQSDYYESALEKFVEYYPFNHTYWISLIQHILTKPKSKGPAVRMYQTALLKNSRCITLWRHYLMWLKGNILKSDPKYLKNQLEKASKIIGTHYNAEFIFQEYFDLESEPVKKYQVMKRALVSPLKQIDRIFDHISNWIDNQSEASIQVLQEIASLQEIILIEKKGTQQYLSQIRLKIKSIMRRLYEPSKKHVQLRYDFQEKLQFDQYKPYLGSYEVWRKYLHFIKNSGNSEFVFPLYQRALISLCDNETLWEDYFLILENQGHHNRVLYLMRSHATFFQHLSIELSYYWLEIEERESPERARELYVELEKQQRHIEAFLRHIQLELRAKDYTNAKTVYETVLTVFASNIQILSYVLIEYAEFMIKYFRDQQFAKKLLKTYFDASVYNEYLFLNYLEFFVKHVEYKDGNKESKQNYEQFLHVLCNGLKRSLDNTPQRYAFIKKVAFKWLRQYVDSIYLVKGAQKKIKQIQIQYEKGDDQSLKRTFQNVMEV